MNSEDLNISMWNFNSITTIQQHLNIMRSTYELLTSDFVEIETASVQEGSFNFYKVRCQQFVSWSHNIQILLEWWEIRIDILGHEDCSKALIFLSTTKPKLWQSHAVKAHSEAKRLCAHVWARLKLCSPCPSFFTSFYLCKWIPCSYDLDWLFNFLNWRFGSREQHSIWIDGIFKHWSYTWSWFYASDANAEAGTGDKCHSSWRFCEACNNISKAVCMQQNILFKILKN